MNIELLNQANKNWENFVSSLNDEEKKGLSELNESLAINQLYYFAANKDAKRFDQSINLLSKSFLYDLEIIPTIYKFYIERDLQELAFEYVQNANDYLVKNDIKKPDNIKTILDNAESIQLLQKYKISFERIRNLSPSKIPSITPETINDKRDLNTFILNEIIQSLRIISDKREALRQVTHENRYNDFLQAILRFRFPFWGWSIHDQPRMGTSAKGADAGNADLVVQSGGGDNLALIEAFILRDKKYTEIHILKCPNYVSTINRYYAIIFFLGNDNDFEKKWEIYKADVLSIDYPTNFKIDLNLKFEDILSEFENVRKFKIAKTLHDTNLELYHIMIDLS